jgi:hypothetical protein
LDWVNAQASPRSWPKREDRERVRNVWGTLAGIFDLLATGGGQPDDQRFFDEGDGLFTALCQFAEDEDEWAISYYIDPVGRVLLLTVFALRPDNSNLDHEIDWAKTQMQLCISSGHSVRYLGGRNGGP